MEEEKSIRHENVNICAKKIYITNNGVEENDYPKECVLALPKIIFESYKQGECNLSGSILKCTLSFSVGFLSPDCLFSQKMSDSDRKVNISIWVDDYYRSDDAVGEALKVLLHSIEDSPYNNISFFKNTIEDCGNAFKYRKCYMTY